VLEAGKQVHCWCWRHSSSARKLLAEACQTLRGVADTIIRNQSPELPEP
jgi:hypothetical protein